jgi:GTP-binding protein
MSDALAQAFTAQEIDAGRKLFASHWDFAFAAGSLEALPPPHAVEIAFAGRSNVGKSTLINALVGRKALARTSRTPGRTQELVFFRAGGPLALVGMPGYGFAQAPKAKVAAWTSLIRAYLKGRPNLARVYVLIDARHGLKPVDGEVLDALDTAALSYQLVLTKSDLVAETKLPERVSETATALSKHPAAFPQLAVVSAQTGAGIPELRAAIARLLRERVD